MGRPIYAANRGGGGAGAVGNYFRRSPVTATILALEMFGFLAFFFLAERIEWRWFGFVPGNWLNTPWTPLTYPFLNQNQSAIGFLFLLFWFWQIGPDLEGRLGSARMVWLFGGSSVLSAGGLGLYAALFERAEPALIGLGLPIAGLTIAWCLYHWKGEIRLYFVLPVSGKILAIVTTVIVYLSYGRLRGLFALGGVLFGFLFVRWQTGMRVRSLTRTWGRPATDRLTAWEKFRLWRARRRMKKVWDSNDPDKFVN